MHEEKWDIWNGTQAWGSSTRHDTVHRAWSQAQGMTQHTGMELSVRHEAAHNICRKTIHEAMHNTCRKIQYMEERILHGLTHNT